DLDVEHMDLAVHGPQLAVGADVDAGVGCLVPSGYPFDDRAGDKVDPELPGNRARPADGVTVERLRPRCHLLRRAEYAPLLREHDELRTTPGRRSHQPIGDLEVAVGVLSRVELDGARAQLASLPRY